LLFELPERVFVTSALGDVSGFDEATCFSGFIGRVSVLGVSDAARWVEPMTAARMLLAAFLAGIESDFISDGGAIRKAASAVSLGACVFVWDS
jgi:hypothetical protein